MDSSGSIRVRLGRRLQRWSVGGLQRALLVFVALPLIVVAALGIRFGFDQANRFQEELLKSDLELVARVIRIPIGEAMAKGDTEAIRVALQSVFTIDRIYGASVFDVDGNRVASGGIAEDDLSHSVIPEQLLQTGETQEEYRRVAGRVVFSHFVPVFDSIGQIKGFIQITRREDDFSDSLRKLTLLSWALWGLLTLAIVLTVLVGHYGGVGRHVGNLLTAMARVEKGDKEHRAPVDGPREVAALAGGLNDMLDSIRSAERELEQTRQAEQSLQLQLKDQEKMAAIGGMARGFAHELGAPLSVIDGRARRLLRHQWVSEKGERELEDIRQQVRHLTRTVNQLLDYSRPGSRLRRRYQAADVLRDMEEVLLPELDEDGPDLVFHCDPELPALLGDPDRLQLGLLCLVRNALQAAASRVEVHAALETSVPIARGAGSYGVGDASGDDATGRSSLGERTGDGTNAIARSAGSDHGHSAGVLRISVRDDGPGLPDVTTWELVEPFYTTKPSGQGTGLGLSIAQTVAREHDGTLELITRPEGGCEASLVLPVIADQGADT